MNPLIKKILLFFSFFCSAVIFLILILLLVNPVIATKQKPPLSQLYLYIDNSASMYQYREKIWQIHNKLLKEYHTNIILISFSDESQWHTNIREISFTGKKSSAKILNSLLSPTTPALVISDFNFIEEDYPLFKNVSYLNAADYSLQRGFQSTVSSLSADSPSLDIGIQIIDSTVQLTASELSFYTRILANTTNAFRQPIYLEVSLFQEKKSKIWRTNIQLENNNLEILLEIPLAEFSLNQKTDSLIDIYQPFLIKVKAKKFKNEKQFKNNEDRHLYKLSQKQIEIVFSAFSIDSEITKIKNAFRNYQKFDLQSKYFLTPQAKENSVSAIAKNKNKIHLIYGNPPSAFLKHLQEKDILTLHIPKIKKTNQLNLAEKDFYRYFDYELPFWSLGQDQEKAENIWQKIAPLFKTKYQTDFKTINEGELSFFQREYNEQKKETQSMMYRSNNYFYLGLNGFTAFDTHEKEHQYFERFWYLLLEYLNQNKHTQQKYYEYFLGDVIRGNEKKNSFLPHLIQVNSKNKNDNNYYLEPLIENSGLRKIPSQIKNQKTWVNYRIPVAEFLQISSPISDQTKSFDFKKIKKNASINSNSTSYLKLRDWHWIYLILFLVFLLELCCEFYSFGKNYKILLSYRQAKQK